MIVTGFYDRLAPFYHLIYEDWEASIQRQASQIDSLFRELWPRPVVSVLDAACGVGTQAIGLAGLGYAVTASDLTPAAVSRARAEAAARGLSIDFRTADLRTLCSSHDRRFDAVIACDNAVPHLLTDEEILAAFREMRRCTRPGGGVLVSVRDYDPVANRGTKIVPYGERVAEGRRYRVFQVWDARGPLYDLAMYFVEDGPGADPACRVIRSRYYAVAASRLCELMKEAGLVRVRRIDGRFFQPVLAGFNETEETP